MLVCISVNLNEIVQPAPAAITDIDFIDEVYTFEDTGYAAAQVVENPELIGAYGLTIPDNNPAAGSDIAFLAPFKEYFADGYFTILIEFALLSISGGTRLVMGANVELGGPSPTSSFGIEIQNGGALLAFSDGSPSGGFLESAALSVGHHVMALTFAASRISASINHAAVIIDTFSTSTFDINFVSFGGAPNDGTFNACYLRRLRIYDDPLDDSNLPGLAFDTEPPTDPPGLSVPRFVEADTFYAQVMSGGDLLLLPTPFTETDAFYSATVAPAAGLTPGLYTETDTFYAAAVVQGWTPALISTLLWLDANDASSFTLSGADVSQWNDKSGNGNHFVQATSGNRPDLDTTTNTINGLPVVSFDGTDDFLSKSGLSGWPADNQTSTSFVIVSRARNVGADRAWWDISTGSLTNETGQFYHNSAGTAFVRIGGNSGLAATTASGAVVVNVAAMWSNTLNKTNREIFKNGTADGSNTGDSGGNSITNMRIGRLFQDVFPFFGDIGEIVVFSGENDTTRQLVEGYLAWKWGLQASLPGGHPYTSAPP